MIKAPVSLQDLRRRIYQKAKSDKQHRFWEIFVHITKIETLSEAYRIAKQYEIKQQAVKAKIRDTIKAGGSALAKAIIEKLNAIVGGWVTYFRVGNSSRAFSEVRDYLETKIRTLLTRRKRRRKTSVGWRRWSNEYLYDVLGLYWDWKIQPLPGLGKGS